MTLPKYALSSSEKMMTFELASEGKRGIIHKLVNYQETNLKDLYNLAFGDKYGDNGEIDDKTISNNGDSEKILATVVATVYAFTDKYPNSWIYATGSSKARTRLYRMGISKFLNEIENDFEIYGELQNDWDKFKIGIEYNGFLVKRK